MNPSRLLLRLDAAIAAARDPLSADCLRVELACYLVRRGSFDDVTVTLKELRKQYQTTPNVAMSAWLSLAEGLLIHFSNMGHSARDKILRAHALSVAAGLTQLSAICAAWLANMDYLVADMAGMTRHVSQALSLATQENHAALARANLVVAHAYHLSGRLDLARPWYARAHGHATSEGDDVTISALMHNMAWLRSANLRQETLCGMAATPSGEHALASAESTHQFDTLFGSTSLHTLVPVLRAQILVVKGKFAEGLAILDEYLVPSIDQGMSRMHANLLADQAWCRVNLGQLRGAQIDAEAAAKLVDPNGHHDDQGSAHSRLSQTYAALGNLDLSNHHAELAAEAWAGHEKLQRETINLLSGLPAGGVAVRR